MCRLQPNFWTKNTTASSLRSCNWRNCDQQSHTSTNPSGFLAPFSANIFQQVLDKWWKTWLNYWNYPTCPHARVKTELWCRITNVAILSSSTESIREHETKSDTVLCLHNSQNSQAKAQETYNDIAVSCTGIYKLPPLTKTTPQIEKLLVRDENTKKLNIPLSTTTLLKRKQEKLYDPLDLKNVLTIDALIDSAA